MSLVTNRFQYYNRHGWREKKGTYDGESIDNGNECRPRYRRTWQKKKYFSWNIKRGRERERWVRIPGQIMKNKCERKKNNKLTFEWKYYKRIKCTGRITQKHPQKGGILFDLSVDREKYAVDNLEHGSKVSFQIILRNTAKWCTQPANRIGKNSTALNMKN